MMKDFVIAVLTVMFLFGAYNAHAGELCDKKARHVQLVHQAYQKGIDRGKILLVYHGPDEWSRFMRKMTFVIYNGATDHMTDEEVYRATYDLCQSN